MDLTADRPNIPLVATDDLTTPTWARINTEVAGAGLWQTARLVPRGVAMVLRLAWHTSRPWTLCAGVAQLLAGGFRSLGLFATVDVLTPLVTAAPTSSRILAAVPALGIVAATYAGRAILDALTGLCQAILAPRVESAARHRVHRAVLRVPVVAFDDPDFNDLVRQGGMHGVWAIRRSTQAAADLLSAVVALTAAVVTLGYLDGWLVLALLVAAGGNVWSVMRASKLGYDSFVRMVNSDRQAWIVGDLITDRTVATEIRALGLAETLLTEHELIADRLNVESTRVERRRAAVRLGGRGVAGLGSLLAYATLGLLLYLGRIPLPVAGTAAVAIGGAAVTLTQAVHEFDGMYENNFYLGLYRALLDKCRSISPAEHGAPPPAPTLIEFEDVSFLYPNQSTPAVHGLNFVIRSDQVVAVVGGNGSGKSTVGKLIAGLYSPATGRILWDGVDTAAIDGSTILEHVSHIGQEPVHWPVTAADNIRIGRLDKDCRTGDRWRDSATVSGADSVIAQLPDGPLTVLSSLFERGTGLSTGQWQRLAVARADYRDAHVMIADEPTSALDAAAETAVFATLGSVHRRATGMTVLITHRLVNIRHADLIIVLDNGRIAETGTHQELLDLDGQYANLYKLQSAT